MIDGMKALRQTREVQVALSVVIARFSICLAIFVFLSFMVKRYIVGHGLLKCHSRLGFNSLNDCVGARILAISHGDARVVGISPQCEVFGPFRSNCL
mmetsp:Transcript_14163/g.27126  ORF Transcript_14163/g.27126 Transcript_14163/m.27126 type:complete len:97 (-) Transcript_14163:393-683(-)